MRRSAYHAVLPRRRRLLRCHAVLTPCPSRHQSSATDLVERIFIKHAKLTESASSITQRTFSSLPAANANLPQHAKYELTPIDFTTSSTISGEESQILEVKLQEGQMLRAESGAMLYMTEGIQMETSMGNLTGQQTSGFQTALTRIMTGQNLMVSDFTYTPPTTSTEDDAKRRNNFGTVALGTDFPAKILKFTLSDYPDSKLICQKGAYLAGSHSVLMEMAYTKNFSSGFFGGEGFILQSLRASDVGDDTGSNDETVFLKAYGTVVKKELKENETLRISSGSLVAMTSTIDFDVTTLPGFKNVLFGGEGLFVTTLTGPGTVWLQGMPIDRMVSEIARRVPSGGGIGLGVPIFGGGGSGDSADSDTAVGAGEATADIGGTDAPEAVAGVTDAAVEADRNATIASSGMMENSADPESAESLFGDAAYGGTPPTDDAMNPETTESDSFSSLSNDDTFAESEINVPEFEEPAMSEPQFEEDETTFSSFDDDQSLGDESQGFEVGEEVPKPAEEGPSLFSQLWDFFTNDDE
ncbi:hypothetical protein HJC23_004096 [Cyclotella cryptica]|uniref:Altered inheritance of mitochondria protein 24, mitochondrial n=1 Tax=Cyclotella cryptica TaxID=29204 RepID=A0ABD3P3J3_9STRA|eukprot:CCRYP_018223-RA/>CCRYP_018223-RA protein AED:0.04 eAED:0.04 QI:87/1/1/1/1/1/2/1718/525